MKKKDLIKKLKKISGDRVIIKVQGGLFLPICDVIESDGCIVLVTKDITKESLIYE